MPSPSGEGRARFCRLTRRRKHRLRHRLGTPNGHRIEFVGTLTSMPDPWPSDAPWSGGTVRCYSPNRKRIAPVGPSQSRRGWWPVIGSLHHRADDEYVLPCRPRAAARRRKPNGGRAHRLACGCQLGCPTAQDRTSVRGGFMSTGARLSTKSWCRRRDSNPHAPEGAAEFKSAASAISPHRHGAGGDDGTRTRVRGFADRRHRAQDTVHEHEWAPLASPLVPC